MLVLRNLGVITVIALALGLIGAPQARADSDVANVSSFVLVPGGTPSFTDVISLDTYDSWVNDTSPVDMEICSLLVNCWISYYDSHGHGIAWVAPSPVLFMSGTGTSPTTHNGYLSFQPRDWIFTHEIPSNAVLAKWRYRLNQKHVGTYPNNPKGGVITYINKDYFTDYNQVDIPH